jgi:hypothetical protein
MKLTTTNLQNLASFEEGGNIYALPQTRFIYEVKAVKTTFIPGPFNKYARKYLGIEGAESMSNVYWELIDMDLKTLKEPDPDYYYSVKGVGDASLFNTVTDLQKEGMLISPAGQNNCQVFSSDIMGPVEPIHFTDLSIKRFYVDKRKKNKRNVAIDSSYNRLPFTDDYVALKTTEEKAREAAAFIFKMRKRRFKLLAGQYEVFPEGTALETSVKEINALEQEYLSLFIGKVESDTITRIFSIVPNGKEKLQRITLFKFSEETGLNPADAAQGNPVVVEISDLDRNEILGQLHMPSVSTTYEGLVFYRVPDKASVKALYGSHVLHEAEVSVCQMGSLVPKYIILKSKYNKGNP